MPLSCLLGIEYLGRSLIILYTCIVNAKMRFVFGSTASESDITLLSLVVSSPPFEERVLPNNL